MSCCHRAGTRCSFDVRSSASLSGSADVRWQALQDTFLWLLLMTSPALRAGCGSKIDGGGA